MERQYYCWHMPLVYKKAGLFTAEKKLPAIYFYEENGSFYEFFTGQYLGKDTPNVSGSYRSVYSDEFGPIIPLTGWSMNRYAGKMPAAKFAEIIKPYLPDQALIVAAWNKRFQEWRNAYHAEKLKMQNQRIANKKKEQQDLKNAQWLDQLLDQRKHR